MKNLYELLGLDRSATSEDVKRAFREQALKSHPDKGGDSETMGLLTEAYKVLKDPEARRAFDEAWALYKETDEVDVSEEAAGYMTTSHDRYSENFRRQHHALFEQYRLAPLVERSVRSSFKPFDSALYSLEEGSSVLSTHTDIYSFIKALERRYPIDPEEPLIEYSDELDPYLAVDIFSSFLTGYYYGDALISIREYFSKEIKRIKALGLYSPEVLLYEGIFEIISKDRIDRVDGDALLLALKKITDYAKLTIHESMDCLAGLFQNKYFRHLFSLATHLYWQARDTDVVKESLDRVDGREATQVVLRDLKMRLSSRGAVGDEANKHLIELIRYVRLLNQFEKDLHDDAVAHDAESYREKAYHILDWIPAFAGKASQRIFINIILQAGLCFQRASQFERNPVMKMADERMALRMYLNTFSIGHSSTPDVELYAFIQGLKYISCFTFQDKELDEMIKAFQHRAVLIADIFPFFETPVSNIEFLRTDDQMIVLMRQYLNALMSIVESSKDDENILDLSYIAILYQAYEACLKNWYRERHDPVLEEKFRLELMEALLSSKNWTFRDLSENLDDPFIMIDRDREGWMVPSRELPIPHDPAIQAFSSLDGVEVNYKTGDFSLSFKRWHEGRPPSERLLTIFDINELLAANITGGIFSLDPVDPDMFYHPFNAMRFAPPSIYKTQLFHSMLLTDYLLKFFTLGQEVRGRHPYDMRPLDELTKHLPAYLKKLITDFNEAQKGESLHRFWIEAEEISVAFDEEEIETTGAHRVALDHIRMVVKKHQMRRDVDGKLIDADEKDEGWGIYVLTPSQKRILEAGRAPLPDNAMLFVPEQNTVCFVEEGEISAPMKLDRSDELLKSLFVEERDALGKVIQNPETDRLLFLITRRIAKLAGKSDRFSPEFVFAKEFTAHYDEFAIYFPEFGRLKALSKVTAVIRIINSLRETNQANMSELNKVLNDRKRWEPREREIDTAIQSLRSDFERKHQEEAERLTRELTPKFHEWRRELDLRRLIESQRESLRDIKRQIGTLEFSERSDEVQKIVREHFDKVKAQVVSEHGYVAFDANSDRIRREVFGQAAKIARDLTEQKKTSCKKQLTDLFSARLKGDYTDYTINRMIEELMFRDRIEELAEALAKTERKRAIDQIERSLNHTASQPLIESALKEDKSIRTIVSSITDGRFSAYRRDMERETERLKRLIPDEKRRIQERIDGRRRLESAFTDIGLGRLKDRDEAGDSCVWVPANIRHEVGGRRSRLVYGGVHIQPHLNVLEKTSDKRGYVVDATFFRETQRKVDVGYIREVRAKVASAQGGSDDTHALVHLRLMRHCEEGLKAAAARGEDIEAIQRKARTGRAEAASYEEGEPPPRAAAGGSGGDRPPPPRAAAAAAGGHGGDRPSSPPPRRPSPPPPPRKGGGASGGFGGKGKDESGAAAAPEEPRRKPSGRPRRAGSPSTWLFDRERMVKGFEKHHIISHTNALTKDHELLELAGFNLQSKANLIYLPTTDKDYSEDGRKIHDRTIHRGRHVGDLSETIAGKMDKIVEKGKTAGWLQVKYNAELRTLLSELRQGLRKGEIALNRVHRSGAVFL